MFQKGLFIAAGVLLLIALQGCNRYAQYDAGTVREIKGVSSAIVEQQDVKVSLPETSEDEEITEYRVGPGDVLVINVPGLIDTGWGDPERTQNVQGFRISSSGKIILPLAGPVEVSGLTVEEIQTLLVEKLVKYIKKPMVTVEIREFKSQPLYLLGQFNQPGLYFLDRPTSLLHGLSMGKGPHAKGNLRGARLLRGERLMPVDIYHLLHNNDLHQNVQLRPGDTIYVPGNEDQRVYVFGAVGKPGSVPLVNGRLNLLQAVTIADVGRHENYRQQAYDGEHVRIIRSFSPTQGQLMVVNLSSMLNGLTMPLPLMDGDIIYIPKTPLGNWNEVMNELLPTLQVIAGTLQPFVQIKYLEDN
jgi:polysaccharide export outer membrane protein